jgi:hypothetical protein
MNKPAEIDNSLMRREEPAGSAPAITTIRQSGKKVESLAITLAVTRGPHKGKTFTFRGHDLFFMGRSKKAHFRLPSKDMLVSRFHFMVEVNPPCCRLSDMDSRNGTYVNGRKVKEADLKNGDQINAGRTTILVSVEGGLPVCGPLTPTGVGAVRTKVVTVSHGRALPAPPELCSKNAPGACRFCANPATVAHDLGAAKFLLCDECRLQVSEERTTFAGYLLIRKLGRGGMGIVHLAVRESDGAIVALKTIIPDATPGTAEVSRFLREAEILRRLSHPHIVSFSDMGEADGRLYFAMEYVPGIDAGRMAVNQGPLPIKKAARLACQLLAALQYAHAQHVVHRDIKPSNLLIARVDEQDVLKLGDFGLARVHQASKLSGLTLKHQGGGTLAFAAPEQLYNFRDVTPAVDQYSAAATLYYLLTGKLIYDFPKRPVMQLAFIMESSPVPIQERRPEIPDKLAQIIHQALDKEPWSRYTDVAEMHKALAPFCR